MATITPGGSAAVKLGNEASVTFPLLPQAWPLTVIPGSDPVSAENPPKALPQQPDPNNTVQNSIISTAETQSSNTGNRLI